MYIMNTTSKEGLMYYQALTSQGQEVACIGIGDGKLEGYSIVPEIKKAIGEKEGLLFLLNWLVTKLKSPMVSHLRSRLLHDYGFIYSKGQLVWEVNDDGTSDPEEYEVWVTGPKATGPVRLEVKARSEEDAKFLVNLNFPRAQIGFTKKVEEKVESKISPSIEMPHLLEVKLIKGFQAFKMEVAALNRKEAESIIESRFPFMELTHLHPSWTPTYEVYVAHDDSQYRPYRLEVEAKNIPAVRKIIYRNFPDLEIRYIKKLEIV